MSSIRYGLIGAGYFGRALGRALANLPGAEVTLVFDPENAEKSAAELGAQVSATLEALCASDEVDALIVASPNWAHAEPVILAAQNGKHVFCEKPIALSYKDCARMVNATKEAGVLFMAGHVTNFMAGVRRSKELIADGVIGDVLFCRAVRNGWEEEQSEVSWKKKRELSGGHLYHHIHELDLVQSIMGPATEVTMVGGNVAHHGDKFGDEDDMLVITLEFGNKTFAALEYGSAFRWPEHYVLIEGTKGAIRIDMQNTGVVLRTPIGTESFLLHRSEKEDLDRAEINANSSTDGAIMYGNPSSVPPLWLNGIVEEEMAYFHGLMTGVEPLAEFAALTDGTAATAAIATADALSHSLRESRKVLVSEITGP
ncbi:MAG: Gfo/Idh/MocA family protein [Rhodoglobus sp.]